MFKPFATQPFCCNIPTSPSQLGCGLRQRAPVSRARVWRFVGAADENPNVPQNYFWGLGSAKRKAMQRTGSVMGMMAVLLPVLAILAVVSINLAHIQVTRTELMIATDAAARAGSRALSETQDVNAAKTVATNIAALNVVNDQPLLLRGSDSAGEIQFGITTQPSGPNGRYVFQHIPTSLVQSGQEVASAFRVLGRRDAGSRSGKVPMIIPGVLNQEEFSTTQEAVAMQVDRDISLVLDRSGSMEWIDYNFPPGNDPFSISVLNAGVSAGLLQRWGSSYFYANGVDFYSYQQWAWEDHFELGPSPLSPWGELKIAVDAFLDVLDTTIQEEQVSVSSYATSASLDAYLTHDYDDVMETVNDLDTGGATAIGAGMNEGIKTLLAGEARPFASKTMVVMTDGIHNRGVSPVSVASNLMSTYNLTIHTVTFGSGADQQRMKQVANIGGGNHYHAASGAELVEVFQEIANNLPTLLTK
jgi:hypothetical protein